MAKRIKKVGLRSLKTLRISRKCGKNLTGKLKSLGKKYLESVIIAIVIVGIGKWTTETASINIKIIRISLEWSKGVGKG